MRQGEGLRVGRGAAWERVLAVAAVGGLTASVLLDLPLRRSALAASDFKTLYASAWCLRHGLNAYSFPELARVFEQQGVVAPASWFGHAPVYPPTTLALLEPLTHLGMVPAAYLAIAASALVFAAAVAALSRYARESFGLPPVLCGVLIALCAAGPLLGFALSVGNLSVVAAGLAILAFCRRRRASVWSCSVALGLALLLKPHLALPMVVGTLLLPELRARRIAIRALLGAVAVALVAGLVAWSRGQLELQAQAFWAIVSAEVAPGGSMNVGSREVLPVMAQISSLRSLLGFRSPAFEHSLGLALGVLGVAAVVLVVGTRRVRTEAEASLAVAAWCAFGLLLTYHRAHDALLLLLALPWLLDRLRRRPGDPTSWCVLGLYAAISVGPPVGEIARIVSAGSVPLTFLVLRQASLAAGLLFCALLFALFRTEVA